MKKLLFLHCITLFFIFCKMHSAEESECISQIQTLTPSQQEIADLARQWVATVRKREHAIKVYSRVAEKDDAQKLSEEPKDDAQIEKGVAQTPELLYPHWWQLELRQREEDARLYTLTVERCVGSPLGGHLGDITVQMSNLTPAEIKAQGLDEQLDDAIRRSCR